MAFNRKKKEVIAADQGVPFYKTRRFKYGSVATGLTAVFIAVVIIINVIFSLLADAYSWRLDMTSYNLYTISDSSRQIVNALTKDQQIEITVMYNEASYPEQFSETIKRFANLSDQITCTYVDPDVNPTALTAYGTEYSITEGAVVVKNGNRIRVIAFEDMYEANNTTGSLTFKTEECLASAVLYVTKAEIPLVYFITGHGESGYDALMSLIANNGADVEEVSLNRLSSFDPLARVMVICGPTIDYSESEIRQLQEFLANDYNYERDLFFFANPASRSLPNLDGFLADWGFRIENNLVLESDEHSASASAYAASSSPEAVPLYLIPSYEDAEVSGVTITADYPSVVPNSRAVTLLFESSGITETTPLMTTSKDSYAKNSDNINTYQKTDGDETGPFTVAAIATRYKYENNVAVESHLFAAGSVDMLNKNYIDYNGNGGYLYRVYQMMVDETENDIIGASKTAGSSYMTLETATSRMAGIVFIVVIPAIFLIIGLIVYIRRRYL